MRAVGTHITDVNASSHSCHHLFLQDETTMESQLEARVTDAWAAQQQSQKKQWERRAGPVKNTIHGSDFSFIRMEKIHPSVSGTLPFLFTQSCPTLSNTMDCSPPGSCVHEISKARILEWVAISSSRGLSQPRDRTQISCVSWIAGRFFTTEPGKPMGGTNGSIFFRVLDQKFHCGLQSHNAPAGNTFTMKYFTVKDLHSTWS